MFLFRFSVAKRTSGYVLMYNTVVFKGVVYTIIVN